MKFALIAAVLCVSVIASASGEERMETQKSFALTADGSMQVCGHFKMDCAMMGPRIYALGDMYLTGPKGKPEKQSKVRSYLKRYFGESCEGEYFDITDATYKVNSVTAGGGSAYVYNLSMTDLYISYGDASYDYLKDVKCEGITLQTEKKYNVKKLKCKYREHDIFPATIWDAADHSFHISESQIDQYNYKDPRSCSYFTWIIVGIVIAVVVVIALIVFILYRRMKTKGSASKTGAGKPFVNMDKTYDNV